MRPYCITTASADSETEGSERSNEESSSENNGSKKEKVGFRDRKIIDYENRLRAYSAPDKIFRYFATYRATTDSEVSILFVSAERTKQMEEILNFQKPSEGLELVILLHTQY